MAHKSSFSKSRHYWSKSQHVSLESDDIIVADSSGSDFSDSDVDRGPSFSKAKAKSKKPQHSISDTIGRWQSSQLKKIPGSDNITHQLLNSLSSLPQAVSLLQFLLSNYVFLLIFFPLFIIILSRIV
ncbi:hypothetical protein BDZ94DRAFT_1056561 [Collybia nuda]|uniref:Uncharacterized protein n=1 Tax=Collybia nuda TaxID=64659 RepID=A0A9P5Y0P2_9AGAR|nr:hypothetical protein BDZ94DRAFT_1056561 [Collybia nuda]